MSKIEGIVSVVYFVRDLETAVAWYRENLGAEILYTSPHYTSMMAGAVQIGLHPSDYKPEDKTGSVIVHWKTADIAVMVKRLVAAGATLNHDITDVGGGIKIAVVSDPEGNPIGLTQGQ